MAVRTDESAFLKLPPKVFPAAVVTMRESEALSTGIDVMEVESAETSVVPANLAASAFEIDHSLLQRATVPPPVGATRIALALRVALPEVVGVPATALLTRAGQLQWSGLFVSGGH
jgi:hypothetical protein